LELRKELLEFLPKGLSTYALHDAVEHTFAYPVDAYPLKPKTVDLEKQREIKAVLTGIRGQYLMFDREDVINMRKYSGYQVAFTPL
jgi:hypothetical protein